MSEPKDGAKDFFRLIVAFFLPPLAVLWQVGFRFHLLLNLFLAAAQVVSSVALLYEDFRGLAEAPEFLAWLQSTALDLLFVPVLWLPAIVHAIWVITTRDDQNKFVQGGVTTFASLVVGILLPPVGVALKRGFGTALLVNLVMTAACYLPGILHASWVITSDQ